MPELATIQSPDGNVWEGDPEAVEFLRQQFARDAQRDPQSIKSRFFIRGEITHREAIKELARTFPGLAGMAMFQPGAEHYFDGDLMDAFASGKLAHGAQCAFQFIGSVWNPGADRKCGPFDLHEAMGVWDDQHRAAFVAWANDPWWP